MGDISMRKVKKFENAIQSVLSSLASHDLPAECDTSNYSGVKQPENFSPNFLKFNTPQLIKIIALSLLENRWRQNSPQIHFQPNPLFQQCHHLLSEVSSVKNSCRTFSSTGIYSSQFLVVLPNQHFFQLYKLRFIFPRKNYGFCKKVFKLLLIRTPFAINTVVFVLSRNK